MERNHEEFERLMMRIVDGVGTPEERAAFDSHAEECEECRGELADFQELKSGTDALRQRILASARLEAIRPGRAVRGLQAVSFGLILAGSLLLAGLGGYHFFTSEALLSVKLGTGAVGAGLLLLLTWLLAVRLRGAGQDPYKEIDR